MLKQLENTANYTIVLYYIAYRMHNTRSDVSGIGPDDCALTDQHERIE